MPKGNVKVQAYFILDLGGIKVQYRTLGITDSTDGSRQILQAAL